VERTVRGTSNLWRGLRDGPADRARPDVRVMPPLVADAGRPAA
jgi:hypothetical protein